MRKKSARPRRSKMPPIARALKRVRRQRMGTS
jgi:hypothetical protein